MRVPQEHDVACQQREVMSALGASEHAAAGSLAVAAVYACGCRAALDGARAAATQRASRLTTLELEAAHTGKRLVQALEDAAITREQLRAAAEREMEAAAQHAKQASAMIICTVLGAP